MQDTDTIAAVSTPPGRGGIGIVRVSGPGSAAIAEALIGCLPPPRSAHYCGFRDHTDTVIDRGVVLYFPAPASFTGEDVLELQGHGGPVVMDMLLAATLEQGARPARPGEFSQRAFLNGRMDLSQAEAVADLIDSGSRAAAGHPKYALSPPASSKVRTPSRIAVERLEGFGSRRAAISSLNNSGASARTTLPSNRPA